MRYACTYSIVRFAPFAETATRSILVDDFDVTPKSFLATIAGALG